MTPAIEKEYPREEIDPTIYFDELRKLILEKFPIN